MDSYLVWDKDGRCMGIHDDSVEHYRKKGYTLVREKDAMALAATRDTGLGERLDKWLLDNSRVDGNGEREYNNSDATLDELVEITRAALASTPSGEQCDIIKCPECGGDGADHEDSSRNCFKCNGDGVVKRPDGGDLSEANERIAHGT